MFLNMFDYKIRSTGAKKVHQVLHLMVDYACFLVKSINLLERNVYTENLFLARSCKILSRILQECHCIQESCKNAIPSKNLARNDVFVRILQDFLNLQEINFPSTRVLTQWTIPLTYSNVDEVIFVAYVFWMWSYIFF